ncbi:DUF3265 domain-containing protein [Vibrio splendidus]|nr:DUF3265 domain-containing protein [Vibrio splendidus]
MGVGNLNLGNLARVIRQVCHIHYASVLMVKAVCGRIDI